MAYRAVDGWRERSKVDYWRRKFLNFIADAVAAVAT